LILKKSQHLKKYIVPMISYAAKSLDKISKSLLPIPSVNYVHKRMEVKRKSEVVNDSNSRMSPDLQLVCDYVAHKDRKKRGDTNKITPPKKKLRVLSRHGEALSTNAIKLPEPADGHEYRRPEVAKILSAYKRDSKKIGLVMQRMIKLKYVPCGIHTLRCLASAINGDQPVLDTDWVMAGGGCPPIASITEIKAIAESMELQSGRVWSKANITKA
jgi:hypothetical protein